MRDEDSNKPKLGSSGALRNGDCNRIKGYCLDPLIHVFLHSADPNAPQLPRGGALGIDGHGWWRRHLILACEKIRGRKFPWLPPMSACDEDLPHNRIFRRWALEHRWLEAWAKCDHAFVAPSRWPTRVEMAFGQFPVPGPHRIANTNLTILGEPYRQHDVAVLLAYASGIRVRTMAVWFGLDPNVIVMQMARGVEWLMSDARFKVWLVRLDWSKMPIPSGFKGPLMARIGQARHMKTRPLQVPLSAAQALCASPAFIVWSCSPQAVRLDEFETRDLRVKMFIAPSGTVT